MTAVAAAIGASIPRSPALNRSTDAAPLTKEIVRLLYAAPPGGAISSPTADGNYIVARVSGVAHPPAPDNNIGYMRGVNQLSGEIAADMTLSLAKAEQQREGLTVNQKLVDATVGGNSGS